jgi:hypothetical protein
VEERLRDAGIFVAEEACNSGRVQRFGGMSQRGTMKLTQAKKVGEIVRPLVEGLPPTPCVGISDPIMRAVELMLKNDLTQIAVLGCRGLIGHIRLDDALRHLGLHPPAPPALHGEAPDLRKHME